jgi:hypothetical protein
MFTGFSRNKLALNGVSLICVSGVKTVRSLYAILRSAKKCAFERIVFVSPKLPMMRIGKFSIEKPFESPLQSINEYNWYCIYELHNHLQTSHALLVQYDSAVINGDKWRMEFLDFDYIGAPWPVIENSFIDPFGVSQRVGNGGFSLRSKKLLEVPLKREIPWDVVTNDFYNSFGTKFLSEDGNICVHNRHLYELEGCKFAPVNVAAQFSYENQVPENQGIKPFGYHKNNPWSIRRRTKEKLSKLKRYFK